MQIEAEPPPLYTHRSPSLLSLLSSCPMCAHPDCLPRILPLRLSPGKAPLCEPAKALLSVLLVPGNLVATTWEGLCLACFCSAMAPVLWACCKGDSEGSTGSR